MVDTSELTLDRMLFNSKENNNIIKPCANNVKLNKHNF